jgi:uncharacterized membrane protein
MAFMSTVKHQSSTHPARDAGAGILPVLRRNWGGIAVAVLAVLSAIYMSYFTILRMNTQYAHLFDLGIMHQTTYNTYKALTTGDFSRFLELTDPYGPNQITRMAIHNDMILAVIAPLYLIWSGPETLLVVQAAVVAAGAVGLYLIAKLLFGSRYPNIGRGAGLVAAAAYLINPAVNYATIYEFHGVTLSIGFIPLMFYFWMAKRYRLSFLFLVLTLITKEQVGLTMAFFGLYTLYAALRDARWQWRDKRLYLFPVLVTLISIAWFLLSMKVIIPSFRTTDAHFALDYYGEFGDTPTAIVLNVLLNPFRFLSYIFRPESLEYLSQLFGPVGYLSFLSLPALAIGAPEFGVNLLSSNGNMRNLIYHYTAVISPIVFIAAVHGLHNAIRFGERFLSRRAVATGLLAYLAVSAGWAAATFGPLPFSQTANIHPYRYPPANAAGVARWRAELADESIRVSSTGKLAPFFTSRRYYYALSDRYPLADYVVINPREVSTSYLKEWAEPAYEAIRNDARYERVFSGEELEVYRKVGYN